MSDTTGLVYARSFRDAPLLRPQLEHVIHAQMDDPANDAFVTIGTIPAGATITDVVAYVSDAFAAADEFLVGMWGEDGAAVDADGIIAAGGVTTQTLGVYRPVTGLFKTMAQNVEVRAQYVADGDTATEGTVDFLIRFAMVDGTFAS